MTLQEHKRYKLDHILKVYVNHTISHACTPCHNLFAVMVESLNFVP